MKNSILIILISAAFSSCVTTLHPLVSSESAITVEKIEGNWIHEDGDYKIYRFYKSGLYNGLITDLYKGREHEPTKEQLAKDSIRYSKAYAIEYTRKNIRHYMLGTFTRLNGNLFINLAPAGNILVNDTTGNSVEINSSRETNTIAKVQLNGADQMKLDFIDGEFLLKQIENGRMKMKHEQDDLYGTFLITASTSDLQQFLVKYGNDPRFFNKENSVILNRKS
jgi:hypothetical protein